MYEIIQIAAKYLTHRKLRNFLTVLGILIAISLIFTLFTIKDSLSQSLNDMFAQFGKDKLFVAAAGFQGPGSGGADELTEKDYDTAKSVPDVQFVAKMLIRNGLVEYGQEKKYRAISSYEGQFIREVMANAGIKVHSGRMLNDRDGYVCTMGYLAATEMFDKEIKVGNKIKINDYEVKVVGIFEKMGNPTDDNEIHLPLKTARIIFNEPDAITAMVVQVKPGKDVVAAGETIKKKMKKYRDEQTFQIQTPEAISKQIDDILGVVGLVLIGIAIFSLVVGSIGIMNSIYTSVLERTRDIGIMKALGASNATIFSLFLLESSFLGFLGGLLGVLLGLSIVLAMGSLAEQAGYGLFKVYINYSYMFWAILFSGLIGAIAGLAPSFQAAKLEPIEAIRYE